MRLLIVVIATFLLALPSAASSAQADAGPWFFAREADTGELIAFTADGTTHSLIASGVTSLSPVLRMGPDSAVLGIEVDGQTAPYYVTPTAATKLMDLPADQTDVFPVIATDRYAVLVPGLSAPTQPASLVDVQAGDGMPLTGDVLALPIFSCCVFSTDGSTLRYVSQDPASPDTWVFRERNLADGTERPFYTVSGPQPVVAHDAVGDNWIVRTSNSDAHTITYVHVRPDGTSETIGDYGLTGADKENLVSWTYFDGQLTSLHPFCTAACTLDIYPDGSGDPIQFQAPDQPLSVQPAYRIDSTRLVARDQSTYWLLTTNAAPLQLGAAASPQIVIPAGSLIAEGRWLPLLDDADNPTVFVLWDLQSGSQIAEIPATPNRYLLTSPHSSAGILLQFSDGTVMRVDSSDTVTDMSSARDSYINYFALLADGTALYTAQNDAQSGIYRYNPADGTSTTIQDGRWILAPLQ